MSPFLTEWQAAEKFPGLADNAGLSLEDREMLASAGSLTLELEERLKASVGVELQEVRSCRIRPELAAYLGVKPFEEALERDVWLTTEGRRLVYARSVIPHSCMDEGLRTLLSSGQRPIGKILGDEGIEFSKDSMEFAIIDGQEQGAEFGLEQAPIYIARRYRLFNRSSDGWTINAAVTEVFTPSLIPIVGGKGVEKI
ncbi:MAG: chorismate lyase [Proteobacteria bacterium]|nr:chorismate lyase [Pseudomonadota bacterium]